MLVTSQQTVISSTGQHSSSSQVSSSGTTQISGSLASSGGTNLLEPSTSDKGQSAAGNSTYSSAEQISTNKASSITVVINTTSTSSTVQNQIQTETIFSESSVSAQEIKSSTGQSSSTMSAVSMLETATVLNTDQSTNGAGSIEMLNSVSSIVSELSSDSSKTVFPFNTSLNTYLSSVLESSTVSNNQSLIFNASTDKNLFTSSDEGSISSSGTETSAVQSSSGSALTTFPNTSFNSMLETSGSPVTESASITFSVQDFSSKTEKTTASIFALISSLYVKESSRQVTSTILTTNQTTWMEISKETFLSSTKEQYSSETSDIVSTMNNSSSPSVSTKESTLVSNEPSMISSSSNSVENISLNPDLMTTLTTSFTIELTGNISSENSDSVSSPLPQMSSFNSNTVTILNFSNNQGMSLLQTFTTLSTVSLENSSPVHTSSDFTFNSAAELKTFSTEITSSDNWQGFSTSHNNSDISFSPVNDSSTLGSSTNEQSIEKTNSQEAISSTLSAITQSLSINSETFSISSTFPDLGFKSTQEVEVSSSLASSRNLTSTEVDSSLTKVTVTSFPIDLSTRETSGSVNMNNLSSTIEAAQSTSGLEFGSTIGDNFLSSSSNSFSVLSTYDLGSSSIQEISTASFSQSLSDITKSFTVLSTNSDLEFSSLGELTNTFSVDQSQSMTSSSEYAGNASSTLFQSSSESSEANSTLYTTSALNMSTNLESTVMFPALSLISSSSYQDSNSTSESTDISFISSQSTRSVATNSSSTNVISSNNNSSAVEQIFSHTSGTSSAMITISDLGLSSLLNSIKETTIPSLTESVSILKVSSNSGLSSLSPIQETIAFTNDNSSTAAVEQSSYEMTSPSLIFTTVNGTTIYTNKSQSNSSESVSAMNASSEIDLSSNNFALNTTLYQSLSSFQNLNSSLSAKSDSASVFLTASSESLSTIKDTIVFTSDILSTKEMEQSSTEMSFPGPNFSSLEQETISTIQSQANNTGSISSSKASPDSSPSSIISALITTTDQGLSSLLSSTTRTTIPSGSISTLVASSDVGLSSLRETVEQSSYEISSPSIIFTTLKETTMSTIQSQSNSSESVSNLNASSDIGFSSTNSTLNTTLDQSLSYSTTKSSISYLTDNSENASVLLTSSSEGLSTTQDKTDFSSNILSTKEVDQSLSNISFHSPGFSTLEETTISTIQSQSENTGSVSPLKVSSDSNLTSFNSALITKSNQGSSSLLNSTTRITIPSESISVLVASSNLGSSSIQETTAFTSNNSSISAVEQSSNEISSPSLSFTTIKETTISTIQSQSNSSESVSTLNSSSDIGFSSTNSTLITTLDQSLSYFQNLNSTTESSIPSLSDKSKSASILLISSSEGLSTIPDITVNYSYILSTKELEQSSSKISFPDPDFSTEEQTTISTILSQSNNTGSVSSLKASSDHGLISINSTLNSISDQDLSFLLNSTTWTIINSGSTSVLVESSNIELSSIKKTTAYSGIISSTIGMEQSSSEISSPGTDFSTEVETMISTIQYQVNSSKFVSSLKASSDLGLSSINSALNGTTDLGSNSFRNSTTDYTISTLSDKSVSFFPVVTSSIQEVAFSSDISSISAKEHLSSEINSIGLSFSTIKGTTISAAQPVLNSSESVSSLQTISDIGMTFNNSALNATSDLSLTLLMNSTTESTIPFLSDKSESISSSAAISSGNGLTSIQKTVGQSFSTIKETTIFTIQNQSYVSSLLASSDIGASSISSVLNTTLDLSPLMNFTTESIIPSLSGKSESISSLITSSIGVSLNPEITTVPSLTISTDLSSSSINLNLSLSSLHNLNSTMEFSVPSSFPSDMSESISAVFTSSSKGLSTVQDSTAFPGDISSSSAEMQSTPEISSQGRVGNSLFRSLLIHSCCSCCSLFKEQLEQTEWITLYERVIHSF